MQAALSGGVRLIQLREKNLSVPRLLELAGKIRKMTAEADALLIINDRIDIALSVGADGVHLGQDDLPVDAARRIAPDLIIGASSHTEEEACKAEAEGASYVNIGPVFSTKTKEWNNGFLGLDGVKSIAPHISIPFTVMGGIKSHHVPELRSAGAKTIALVTAITAAPDPEKASKELLRLMQ